MTKAGLDPSRIQERAEMLAKLHGSKRKRTAEDEDVDMDDDGSAADDVEDAWMDVDGQEGSAKKRVKTNSGGVVAKREPRSQRQFAGMRNEEVSFRFKFLIVLTDTLPSI